MKKFLIIALLSSAIIGCKKSDSFLDNKTSALDEQQVFSDSIRTMAFLTRIYQDIGFSFVKGRWDSHGNTELATDDAEYNLSGVAQRAVILYSGTLSPLSYGTGSLNNMADFWTVPYANIRRVNLLLSKLPTTPLSAGMQQRVKGEARFLRAWYYTQLLIAFGGVPVIEDQVFGITDVIDLPRTSFEDFVKYLSKELDEAAQLVPGPDDYAEQDFGRVTKGACLALKSRLLLYAASPLFNGGSIATNADIAKIVSYPTYDVKHWQAAAAAAEVVINSGYYLLHAPASPVHGFGFYDVFLRRSRANNKEYIFAFNRANNRDMEGYYLPASRGGARNSMPSHNLVDAFPMKNGKPITDPTSGYNPNNPYVNRDPRLGFTIICNGSIYYTSANAKTAVFTYVGASQDGFSDGSSTTGYYTRKMCDSNIAANSSLTTERGWPLIRYAEILLNYAEAINESGQPQLAYPKLIEIRQRAGINAGADNLYGLKPNMTVEEMREVIRNERRVELAFEDHRWHDIRRWKIAMVTNNAFNKRMKITRIGTTGSNYTYEVVETIRRHNFRPEMYLMPIPDPEIRKMPAMVQNPGW